MISLNEIVVVLKGFILHKGKVLTVQRAHDDEVGGGTWELVGGQIRFGEDLENGAVARNPRRSWIGCDGGADFICDDVSNARNATSCHSYILMQKRSS
jgi:8-oxo-dGTP pyrophosphatase MutT (NUDIX family)